MKKMIALLTCLSIASFASAQPLGQDEAQHNKSVKRLQATLLEQVESSQDRITSIIKKQSIANDDASIASMNAAIASIYEKIRQEALMLTNKAIILPPEQNTSNIS